MSSTEALGKQTIILLTDGSSAELTTLLNRANLMPWRKEKFVLAAIVPRPVDARFYEPQFFKRTISEEEVESVKKRLQHACEQLLIAGCQADVEIIYQDNSFEVTNALKALHPDLIVGLRPANRWNPWGCLNLMSRADLIKLSPCPLMLV